MGHLENPFNLLKIFSIQWKPFYETDFLNKTNKNWVKASLNWIISKVRTKLLANISSSKIEL